MRLPPASYDFSTLYLPGTYPNTPRELFTDVFYPNENPFPRSYLDDDFYKTLFEDLATRYKGIEIRDSRDSRDDGLPDSDLYLNKHLYRGHLVGAEELERNLEYAPFFLTFWAMVSKCASFLNLLMRSSTLTPSLLWPRGRA